MEILFKDTLPVVTIPYQRTDEKPFYRCGRSDHKPQNCRREGGTRGGYGREREGGDGREGDMRNSTKMFVLGHNIFFIALDLKVLFLCILPIFLFVSRAREVCLTGFSLAGAPAC